MLEKSKQCATILIIFSDTSHFLMRLHQFNKDIPFRIVLSVTFEHTAYILFLCPVKQNIIPVT